MWEHIHWLHGCHLVIVVEQLEVARLGGRVAAHIDNALWSGEEDGVDDISVHTGTRWVGDDHVGTSVGIDEILVEDILHVSGKEERVVQTVDLSVLLGIYNGLRHIFNAYDLSCLMRHKVGDGASASIKVVNQFVSSQFSKTTCHFVEVVGLLCVGLIERLGPHLELQVLHPLVDIVFALEDDNFLIDKGVVELMVIHIEQGRDFREFLSYMRQESEEQFFVFSTVDLDLEEQHQFCGVGRAYHHVAQETLVLSEIIE